jgi:hypothetical protein
MWRAFFLAIGVFAILLGVQCLGVAQFTMKMTGDPTPATAPWESPGPALPKKINPAPWSPWSFLVTGAVVCLYSFTLPRRASGG